MAHEVCLEPAITPANAPAFLLDWELTMKCNLDCSYCVTGTYGGHDNTTRHPTLDECLRTIDFMYRYVDLYMRYKVAGLRKVVLNVYGGEAMHHPDIVEILKQARERYLAGGYAWHLTITTTSNLIMLDRQLANVVNYVDEFTASYHTECSDKQKHQFKDNLKIIKLSQRRLKCVVLMHSDPERFRDAEAMIEWLKKNEIEYLPRQLDSSPDTFNYASNQVTWFDNLYKRKSWNAEPELEVTADLTDLSDQGRACCGGRQLCEDQKYKERTFFTDNKFPGWSCSVNWFFLHIKQVNGEIFVNKDCKMNFDNKVGTIGTLADTETILQDLDQKLKTKTLPVIQCAKAKCYCGLCAPKARDRDTYDNIVYKYHPAYYQERLNNE